MGTVIPEEQLKLDHYMRFLELLTCGTAILDPLLESFHIVKQLRDDELGSSVTFDFQPLHLGLCSLGVGMRCRIASHSNAESILVLLADILDEIIRMLEIVGLSFRFQAVFLRSRWITTKSENVVDTQLLTFLDEAYEDTTSLPDEPTSERLTTNASSTLALGIFVHVK